jgi:hypothetical protein
MTLFCFAISTTSSLNVFVEFIYKQTSWSFSSHICYLNIGSSHTGFFGFVIAESSYPAVR